MRILQARSFKDLRQVEPSLTSNLPGIFYMHVILWNLEDFSPTVFYEDWFTVSTSLQIATLVYKWMPNTPYFESRTNFKVSFQGKDEIIAMSCMNKHLWITLCIFISILDERPYVNGLCVPSLTCKGILFEY